MLLTNIIVFTLVFSVISFVVFGILFLDEGYRNKKSAKVSRGWKLVIWSTILIAIFTMPVVSLLRCTLSEDRWESLNYEWYLIIFIFLPVLGGIISAYFGNAARLLVIGYRNQRNGKNDSINIAFGYTLLATGAILFISTIMFIISCLNGGLM